MAGARRLRFYLVGALVVVMAALVGVRLYQIQMLMSERFRIRARDQYECRTEVPAVRGSILDRHGRELAASVETLSLFAHPWRVEDPERAAELLAPVLEVPPATLLATLRSDKRFAYLKRFLDPDKVAELRRLALPIGGSHPFGFETGHKRVYPGGRLAVHVVGFANIDGTGVEGIEKQFDTELKGDPAIYLDLQDARSGRVRQLIRSPEKEPLDVLLALDTPLQHAVERELDRAMRRTGSRAASAILLDPATGQVLALANRPAADLSRYARARESERSNRAVVHYYEPGSVFKIVAMAAALEHGRARDGQHVFCENGAWTVGSRVIHDTSPHGMLSLRDVLVKSSNIGMAKICHSVEPQTLWDTITRFGFGERTGIELPGESPGSLAPVARWSGLTRFSLAFGQEIGVTPLQMASAIAAIANDGVLVPPRLVLGTRDSRHGFVRLPAAEPRRVISSRAAQEITGMLRAVVERGTGTRAAVPGYRVAGKSGTAQKAVKGGYSETDFMASFGGFAPTDDPRVVCLVVLDSPRGRAHQGGQVAAPVFGRILSEALRHLRVPSHLDSPVVRSASRPRSGERRSG